MPEDAGRIVVSELTKTFGDVRAVDGLSFTVEPGSVTGFLGPNGAGKTTTLRMALGLVVPDSGTATIGGRTYASLKNPIEQVGAVLDPTFHPGRSGRNHLRAYAVAAGLPDQRVDEVLDQVGLASAARRKAGGYSLGMRQRLGLATALLGNPQVLILDEPANGLDPEGITWLRGFLRHLARGEGRTVLVSSHLLAEVQQTVDRVVILAAGRLVREGTIQELAGAERVRVRTPDPDALRAALPGLEVGDDGPGTLVVSGADTDTIGAAAFRAGVELHELATTRSDLEEIYFRLTTGQEQFAAAQPGQAVA
ncbi:MAG: ABC transporter ATP-binding protein [Actinomycetota bacterium]|nr:ABC transporter ATP-binding protein [Actinomycetota bacterium]